MKSIVDTKTKYAETLKGLNPSVTKKEKQEAATKFKVHYNTILNYLRGEVADIELGLKLVEFFNGKVSARMIRVRKILAA